MYKNNSRSLSLFSNRIFLNAQSRVDEVQTENADSLHLGPAAPDGHRPGGGEHQVRLECPGQRQPDVVSANSLWVRGRRGGCSSFSGAVGVCGGTSLDIPSPNTAPTSLIYLHIRAPTLLHHLTSLVELSRSMRLKNPRWRGMHGGSTRPREQW